MDNQHAYPRALQKHDPQSTVSQAWTFKNSLPEYGPEPGVASFHSRATPLFEVGSVRICNNQFNQFSSIQVYGTILLIDDYGNEFYIFDCKDRNDAKTLLLGSTTPPCVILQSCFQPRGVPSKFCLIFQLKRRLDGDGEEDIVILDDYKHMDCTNQVFYDKPQLHVFDSNYGQYVIIVEATIFQCALLAEVGIIVEKSGKDKSGVAEITGALTTLTRGLNDNDFSRTLLDVSCENFEFGNYIPLSTLAVPAYSSLKIQGQVSVNGKDLGSVLIFEPYTISNLFHEKQIGGKPYRIRVIVYWKQGARSLPEAKILEYYANASETPLTNERPTSKLLETENAYYIEPNVRQYMRNLKWDVDDFPTELLEIFSISVCAFDHGDSTFSLRGKVKCYDDRECICIFDSDTGGVSTFGDIVKLVPDLGRGFVGSYLGIITELTDNQGREISFGSATYDFVKIETWRDKRICSVIRGQNGFAAVHYTIFTDAVLAKLSFEVVDNFESGGGGATGCKVHGSINTSYSNFNYSTHYAKKYYRSTLFEKQECDAVKLTHGEKIPLSKSAVAVPVYGLLVVEAIVYAQNGKHHERLRFKETFSPAAENHEDHHVIAKSRSFSLSMHVDWVRHISLI